MGFFDKLKQGLSKTKSSFDEKLNNVFSNFRKVDEELLDELEEALIMSDVGVETSTKIITNLRNKIKKEKDIKNMMKNFQGASFIENYPEKGIQVKGNEVIIRYTSMNWTTGYRVYVFTFKYKDGGLKRNYDGDLKYLDKCYHAKKDIKIYEKPESSRVAYTLKMGEGSYIEKYYFKKDKLY